MRVILGGDSLTSYPEVERGLVEKAKNGDEEAWTEIFLILWPRLYRYHYAFLGPDDCEDMAAEVIAKVFEHIDSYQTRANTPFEAWVFRIARNTNVSFKRRRQLVTVRADGKFFSWQDKLLLGSIEVEEYCRYLGDRSVSNQIIIGLYAFFGLKYAEIAPLVGISENNAKNRAHKTRKILRAQIEGAAEVPRVSRFLSVIEFIQVLEEGFELISRGLNIEYSEALLLRTKFMLQDRGYSISEIEAVLDSMPPGFVRSLCNLLYR